MNARFLILETSQRIGVVALACGGEIVGSQNLDEARRHARDLVPSIQGLLVGQGWRANELDSVIVSHGPGSYTGLRVGIMSAKTLAYVTGCRLLAIGTFDAIVQLVASPVPNIDVIADAQKGHVYVQRFGTHPEPLSILPMEMWLESALAWNVSVTGPGLEVFADRLPKALSILPRETWLPQPAGLLKVALARMEKGDRDEPFAVEPLYLQASSAELQWPQVPAS